MVVVHLWAFLDPLGLGTIDFWLYLSFFLLSLFFSSFSCLCPDPAALSIGFAAAPVTRWLVVRLSVLVVRLTCSRPNVGGPVGWLLAPVGLYAPGGVVLQLTVFLAVFQLLTVQ